MLMVGRTGSGKSTSGNMILQKEAFDTSPEFCSVTQECSLQSNTILGMIVQVMDTPGLFDTGKSHEEVGLRIVQCVINMHPGPDVILYVIRIGEKYTAQDFAAYRRFKMLLGSSVTRHMMVLFTGGDKLRKTGTTIEQFVKHVPDNLHTVLRECGGQCIVLNNELTFANGQTQVANLLGKVQELRRMNDYRPYTCYSYGRIAKTLEEVEAVRREVRRKLGEVEEQEARATQYWQEREAQFKQMLDRLTLTQGVYDKRMTDIAKQMEEEKQKRLDAWLLKKEQEERALEARKKEEERRLLEKKREHDRRLRWEREEHERQIRNEQERQRRIQEEERERQRTILAAEAEERRRSLAKRERELEREREAVERRLAEEQRASMQQALRTVVMVGRVIFDVSRIALRLMR
ncbi:hypothetical protein V1264_017102 [Littorina saxatilis]|uniref:AIG1-type G domain-containing protein n=1 Tax=Littorina saxatilis TaxID=31220 RepID=A0AAN9BHG3_9CAEN